MQNGHESSAATAPRMPEGMAPVVQINPPQAAAFALEFLERASHTRAERERFDIAQALLTAIMQGRAVISAPQPPLAAAAAPPAELAE